MTPQADAGTLRTPQEWELEPWCAYHVEDYAGWRASGLRVSTRITREEFERLAALSKIRLRHPVIPEDARTVPVAVTTLGELPDGAIFIAQDSWNDGRTLYVKRSNYGRTSDETGTCLIGSTVGDRGAYMSGILVQEVNVSPEIAFVLRLAAGMTVAEARRADSS